MMLGLSQTDLGSVLGVTFQQIQKQERGANRVSASALLRLATALKVPVSFFFEGAPGGTNATPLAPDFTSGFLTTTDGLAIARAFDRMDPKVRRRFVALAAEMTA